MSLFYKKAKLSRFSQREFTLNDIEKKIISIVRTVCSLLPNKVIPRIVGGWTRDKILGTESDDIDIAVDSGTGADIANAIKAYANQNNIQGIGKIHSTSLNKSNSKLNKKEAPTNNMPDSAELFVTAVDMFGQKVEFSNLRTETYSSNSRVPIATATNDPKEDAVRRDLTIGALYYNILNGQIEDYSGGLQDLGYDQNLQKTGSPIILRTPRKPEETYMEDPLRVVRLLRFHSKFTGSIISPEIIRALKYPQVHEAYSVKVSPERAGPELLKLLQGSNPTNSVKLLLETGLYKKVFDVPEMQGLHDINIDQQTPHHELDLLNHTLAVLDNINKRMLELGVEPDKRGLMNMVALFHDFGKMHPEIRKPKEPTAMFERGGKQFQQLDYLGHEDKSAQIAESAMKSIGIPENERNFVTKLVTEHMRPHTREWSNKAIGRLLRDLIIPGQEEKQEELREMLGELGIADSMGSKPSRYHEDVELKKRHMQQWRDFHAQQASISGKSGSQPILNGGEVMALFPELKRGPWISFVNGKLLEWQDSGEIISKEQATQKLMSIKQEVLQAAQNAPQRAKQLPPAKNLNIKPPNTTSSYNWWRKLIKKY